MEYTCELWDGDITEWKSGDKNWDYTTLDWNNPHNKATTETVVQEWIVLGAKISQIQQYIIMILHNLPFL